MSIDLNNGVQARLRLHQFLSPALPVGSYSYSQGLEWAVEKGWIHGVPSFKRWIMEQIATTLGQQELPILIRLYRAVAQQDINGFVQWSQFAVAIRDTAELRQEERARGEAYLRVLETITAVSDVWPRACFLQTPLASLAFFCEKYNINEQSLLIAYAHNWLEASLVTGIKVIPLGQSAGQKMLFDLSPQLMAAINQSATLSDDAVGISLPGLSMASCGHEVQYSRVYRS